VTNSGKTEGIGDPDLQRCFDALLGALDHYESIHPRWVTENYLFILESSLESLRHYVESDNEKEVTWESPFVELHYPIEWNWEAWERGEKNAVFLSTGTISKDSSRDTDSAKEMLTEILMKHIRILTLQRLTNFVGLEKRGDYYTPIMSNELADAIRAVKGKRKQRAVLQELFRPHAMGAAYIDADVDELQPNQRVSRKIAKQLERLHEKIDLPSLTFNVNIDGHSLRLSLILQIHPFIVDIPERVAYYPITIGIHLVPAGVTDIGELSGLMEQPWAQPWRWPKEDRRAFWDKLFQELHKLQQELFPDHNAVHEAVVSVTAKIKIPVTHSNPDETNALIRRLTDTFMQTGQLLEMNCQLGDQATLPEIKQTVQNIAEDAEYQLPDSLSNVWLRRALRSPYKWWFIIPATLTGLAFAVWATLPDEAKMRILDWLTEHFVK
jgi:hypothetical protein